MDVGVTGYLCKVRDGSDLARSMDTFLALTRTERVQMGLAGRVKMERTFDQTIVVEAYRNILTVAISTKASAGVRSASARALSGVDQA